MNRPNARVVEASIPAAESVTRQQFGRAHRSLSQRRERDDITQWLEEQDEAELELLIAEVANKNNRAYRRSMNY